MGFERYSPQDWWVSKIPRHRAQMFSYKYVIQPAANYRRTFAFHTFRVVIKHLFRAYKFWFYRCKDMACRDLWLPTPPDNNPTVLHRAVKHCLYCVPTQVLLHKKFVPISVKPCNQYRICPFCASRFAEDVYRRFVRARKAVLELDPDASVTSRVETYRVKARGFTKDGWAAKTAIIGTRELAAVLRHERDKYQKIAKELSVHTYGAFWNVVVFPREMGWQVEVRQLFITPAKSAKPANRKRKSATLNTATAKLRDYDPAIKLLGVLVGYPGELLTGYAELTAASLNARRCLRLFNGTGQLYRKGRTGAPKEEPPLGPSIP